MLVQLDQFEGPLGLLLYLIRKEEMDIYDIEIHRITSQYLSYIKQLPSLDLEQAGEFCAMAASLIQIKSKMLLPNYDENGEEIEEEDPRKPLVQKLLEYQKYQEASKDLYERPLLGRDTWKRGKKEQIDGEDGGVELEESALFSLIACYRSVVKKAAKANHKVAARFQTIASRILELTERIRPGKKVTLKQLMRPDEWTSTKYLITFLSTLELGKLGYVKLFQADDCGDIHIEGKKEIAGDVVARVAEYDDDSAPEAFQQAIIDQVEKSDGPQLSLVQDSETSEDDEMASDEDIFAAELEDRGADNDFVSQAREDYSDAAEDIDIDAINAIVGKTLDNGGYKPEDEINAEQSLVETDNAQLEAGDQENQDSKDMREASTEDESSALFSEDEAEFEASEALTDDSAELFSEASENTSLDESQNTNLETPDVLELLQNSQTEDSSSKESGNDVAHQVERLGAALAIFDTDLDEAKDIDTTNNVDESAELFSSPQADSVDETATTTDEELLELDNKDEVKNFEL